MKKLKIFIQNSRPITFLLWSIIFFAASCSSPATNKLFLKQQENGLDEAILNIKGDRIYFLLNDCPDIYTQIYWSGVFFVRDSVFTCKIDTAMLLNKTVTSSPYIGGAMWVNCNTTKIIIIQSDYAVVTELCGHVNTFNEYLRSQRTLFLKQLSFSDTIIASHIESYKLIAKNFPREQILNCKE